MMGLGTRFSQNGYSEYKPFVRTNTDHLIKKVIKPLFGYFEDIFVVCNKEIESQIISIFKSSSTTSVVYLNNISSVTKISKR